MTELVRTPSQRVVQVGDRVHLEIAGHAPGGINTQLCTIGTKPENPHSWEAKLLGNPVGKAIELPVHDDVVIGIIREIARI